MTRTSSFKYWFAGLALLAAFLVTASSAIAMPPAIQVVSQHDRHPSVSLSAPRASSVTVYIASKPDVASDGSFLQENVVETGLLTDSEIQSGQWLDSSQIDPGTYYVMLRASLDFTTCVSYDPNTYTPINDPACADGFSAMTTLNVPTPKTTYTVKALTFKYLHEVELTLTGNPLGAKLPYRVCWNLRTGKKKCVSDTLNGYSWNSDASDMVDISTKGMSRRTKFTWYARGSSHKVLHSKTISVS
jgi:hypothetical protein